MSNKKTYQKRIEKDCLIKVHGETFKKLEKMLIEKETWNHLIQRILTRLSEFSLKEQLKQNEVDEKNNISFLDSLLNDDSQLKDLTGLSRGSFTEVLKKVEQENEKTRSEKKSPNKQTKKLSIPHILLMTLIWLKHALSFGALAAFFKISKTTVSRYLHFMIEILRTVLEDQIRWPNEDEMKRNNEIWETDKILDCAGVLDCTDHPRVRHGKKEKLYWSFKRGGSTIKSVVVCDPVGKIIFFQTGFPGSIHDSNCVWFSKLIPILKNKKVLGDKAFHRDYAITPHKETQTGLTQKEKEENQIIQHHRSVIENVFSILKNFKISKSPLKIDVIFHGYVMEVCAFLYNLEYSDHPLRKQNRTKKEQERVDRKREQNHQRNSIKKAERERKEREKEEKEKESQEKEKAKSLSQKTQKKKPKKQQKKKRKNPQLESKSQKAKKKTGVRKKAGKMNLIEQEIEEEIEDGEEINDQKETAPNDPNYQECQEIQNTLNRVLEERILQNQLRFFHGGIEEDWEDRTDINGWVDMSDMKNLLELICPSYSSIEIDFLRSLLLPSINFYRSLGKNQNEIQEKLIQIDQNFKNWFLECYRNRYRQTILFQFQSYNEFVKKNFLDENLFNFLSMCGLGFDIILDKERYEMLKELTHFTKQLSKKRDLENILFLFQKAKEQKGRIFLPFWTPNHYLCYVLDFEKLSLSFFNSFGHKAQIADPLGIRIRNFCEEILNIKLTFSIILKQPRQIGATQCGPFVIFFIWMVTEMGVELEKVEQIIRQDLVIKLRYFLLISYIKASQSKKKTISLYRLNSLLKKNSTGKNIKSFFV
ncbi:thap domain protein [Anaeramoeba ignava]|uniref:Thap domain protein n=1 Tax=Anaeramoeba ignava TaxID=1746090 RepID=A0A9Q0LKT5_ANAIG|nr:thap domain protein [Anaeramoeba ignava]